MKLQTSIGLLLVAIACSSVDAKFFKHKWIPKILPSFEKHPVEYVEQPKIVEVIKHVPVIQKVEVIKEVEVIKTVQVPVEVIKEVEVIKHVPIIQEVIKEVVIVKEIPIIQTIEIPKPYEVVRHVPIVKTVEVEKQVIKKVPVAEIQHITKEITLPKISLPSIPHIKPLSSHFHHSSAEPAGKSYVSSSHSGPQSYETYGSSSSSAGGTSYDSVAIEA